MTTALPLAVQLYSFRDESRRGSEQFTLDRGLFDELARLGYGGVETVGVPGGDVAAAREALAQAGLAVTSTHSWASIDDADGFDRVCADAAAIGSPRVIVSGGHFRTRDEVARFADSLNAGAAIAARHGHPGRAPQPRPRDARRGGRRTGLRADPRRDRSRGRLPGRHLLGRRRRRIAGGGHPRPGVAGPLAPRQGRARAPAERERRPPVREQCRRQRRRGPGARDRGGGGRGQRRVADRRAGPCGRPGDRRRAGSIEYLVGRGLARSSRA